MSTFLKLNDIQKQIFVKENPVVDASKTTYSTCGFLLDIEGANQTGEDKKKTWYDFVVEKEHLFIRNIYSREELASMDNISDVSDYYEQFGCFIKIVIQLEKCLCSPIIGKNFFTST